MNKRKLSSSSRRPLQLNRETLRTISGGTSVPDYWRKAIWDAIRDVKPLPPVIGGGGRSFPACP